jgi:hypothetical protein
VSVPNTLNIFTKLLNSPSSAASTSQLSKGNQAGCTPPYLQYSSSIDDSRIFVLNYRKSMFLDPFSVPKCIANLNAGPRYYNSRVGSLMFHLILKGQPQTT